MTGSMWKGVAVLLLCAAISFGWSYEFVRSAKGAIQMIDFGAIYYGAQCEIHHIDPYGPGGALREFRSEGGRFLTDPFALRTDPITLSVGVNLPTALVLTVPLALLPWGVAQTLWMVLTAGLLALGAALMWDLGAKAAPAIWICLAGFLLANTEGLLASGNLSGVAVGLCVVGVWGILSERYALAGVLLLAISLVLKPHDSGFIWLYFLLAGGTLRKRALQTLAITCVLGLIAVIWIAPTSPHWIAELHKNLTFMSGRGGLNNPGPLGWTNRIIFQIISMQAALSVLWDNPRFYNPASYLIIGSLIMLWALGALRKRTSPHSAPLALAAISALSLLPVYHRTYDAKLLLLTLPACAILWTEGGARRWIALALTSAGILVTSDLPLVFLLSSTKNLSISTATLSDKVASVLLFRPAPLVLLALGCFYLWVFLRYDPPQRKLPLWGKAGAVADLTRVAAQDLPKQAAVSSLGPETFDCA